MRPVVICLHGWGGSKESWTELKHALRGADVDVLAPDLPGFGEEPEPDTPLTLDDYTVWVETWIRRHVTPKPVHLVGHSHGGRIALRIAERKHIPVAHLYLCAAAGMRQRMSAKRAIGLAVAKTGNAVLSLPGLSSLKSGARKVLYRILRVHDYERASPVMQQTMANILAEDLRTALPAITVPTDIFWGTDDKQTPYSDALEIQKGIKGSRLHTFPGVRHRVQRDKADEIARVIRDMAA